MQDLGTWVSLYQDLLFLASSEIKTDVFQLKTNLHKFDSFLDISTFHDYFTTFTLNVK